MNLSPKQREALTLIAEGRFFPYLTREEDGWHARWQGVGSDNRWVDEYVRSAAMTRLTEDAEDQRHESLHDAWLEALSSRSGLVLWNESECADFSRELEVWAGNAAEEESARQSLVFRFCPSSGPNPDFSIVCDEPHSRATLTALGLAVYVYTPLRNLRRAADGRLHASLTRAEAEGFVCAGARALVSAGYGVSGVDLSAPIVATAEIGEESETAPTAGRPKSRLIVHVAGEEVSADEVRFLLDQGSSLVYFRDRWIEVDRGILKEALRALEKGMPRSVNPIAFALGLSHVGHLEVEEVRAHGWLRGLVHSLRESGRSVEPVSLAEDSRFRGTLREYQAQGVAWMDFLSTHGFGALLADDMGLGKTAQAIRWLLLLSARPEAAAKGPALVVAPLTLLSNWKHEFVKFAPSLRVAVHQGENRVGSVGFRRLAAENDVILTSYNLLVRDYSRLSAIPWQVLVLDEAQVIKNPETQVAKAVCSLRPPYRLALTGTPIENSVADLWSIEEFLNPGFLGESRQFEERFVRPISLDAHGRAARRLKRALEPFVLRRLKSDPRVSAELGEKREVREYCRLTPRERNEYETALELFRSQETSRGDIFALLTRLKLICDGFDGQTVSGSKLERLTELLDQIFANGESALVFSQYAKVGRALQENLSQHFSRRMPFLHGALSPKAREEEIARFNRRGPKAFILSLKAGGFGLNLTKATHVIHFDRWWNPAIENQATDRAHRLGQDKSVFVHLMISAGTIEERVDEILGRKESLRELVSDGETFWKAAKLI